MDHADRSAVVWPVRAGVILAIALTVMAVFMTPEHAPLAFEEHALIQRSAPAPPLGRWIASMATALPATALQQSREGQLARIYVGTETWLTHHLPFGRAPLAAALHALAALLFLALVWNLDREHLLAFFSALLFALHPTQTQTVIWTAARGISLAGVLLLGAALALSFISPPARKGSPPGEKVHRFSLPGAFSPRTLALVMVAIGLYGAACLAAPVAAAGLPLLLLVLLRRVQAPRLLAFGLVLAAIAVVLFGFGSFPSTPLWWIGGALRDLTHLVWPFGIGPMDGGSDIEAGIGIVVFLILTALAFFAPLRTAFYAAWTLLAVAALRPAGADAASSTDLYLAAGGFAALLAQAARTAAQATSGQVRTLARATGPLVPALVAVFLAGQGTIQERVWHDDLTLWVASVKNAPNSWEAHYHLGIELQSRAYLIGAAEHYRRAIGLAPKRSEPYTNLGVIRERQGKTEVALRLYKRAAALNPDDYAALRNLALLQADLEHWPEAEDAARRAVHAEPRRAEAYSTLGAILLSSGAPGPAQASLLQAIHLDPDFVDAHYNLGLVYTRRGRIDLAMRSFERTLTLDPANARARLQLEMLRQSLPGPVRRSEEPDAGKNGP